MQGVRDKRFLPQIEKRKREPKDIQLVGRTEENRLPEYLLFICCLSDWFGETFWTHAERPIETTYIRRMQNESIN